MPATSLNIGGGALAAALLLAAGCTVPPPPPLRTPPPPAPADTNADAGVASPLPAAWWTAFGDPELTRLVGLAQAENRDLAQAAARLDAARARAKIAGADAALQVTGSADAARQRTSERTAVQTGHNYASQVGGALGFSYEVDLWGRIKAARAAAEKEVVLTAAERAAAEVSLLAEVARQHLTRLALRRERAVVDEQIARFAETERLQAVRVDSGFATELDLQRTRVERASAEGEREQLRQREQACSYALALLCGQAAGAASGRDAPPVAIAVPTVPRTLPLALLEARPDVAARRAAWEAAAQRVRVAHADRLPTLRLTGAFGYASQYPDDLLNWQSRLWSLTAGLTAPLLDGGRLRANLDLARAQLREAAASYESSVLTAYREVADALNALEALAGQHAAAERAREASRRALSLARERYEKGFATYLDVVESDRSLLSAQRTLVRLEGERQCATVSLIQAMGINSN